MYFPETTSFATQSLQRFARFCIRRAPSALAVIVISPPRPAFSVQDDDEKTRSDNSAAAFAAGGVSTVLSRKLSHFLSFFFFSNKATAKVNGPRWMAALAKLVN